MTSREQALKNQVRKAQALIAQFEDGSGRHNSNLLGTDRDAGAQINLTDLVLLSSESAYIRMAAFNQQLYGYVIAQAVQLGYIDAEFIFEHGTITPKDELETYLIHRGLLRARTQDCQVGQVVRIEAIDCDRNWARARGHCEHELPNFVEPSQEVAINIFEFERTRYQHNGIVRAFWKRVA